MAYDISNVQAALQYMQQQAAQGRYTPSNGVQGLPSKGWDGWSGYSKPPSDIQQTDLLDTNGMPPGYYSGGIAGGPRTFLQTPNPDDQTWTGEDGSGQSWNAQMNSQAAPPGYNPGMDLPGVVNGVQTHNFTPQGNNHVFGDLTGYKNNPASAAGTDYARFMTGGNGNGPQDFNRAAAYGYMRSGGMTGPGAQRQAMQNRQAMAPRFGPAANRMPSLIGGSGAPLSQTVNGLGRGVMGINPNAGIQSQGGGAGGAQRFNPNPGGRGPIY